MPVALFITMIESVAYYIDGNCGDLIEMVKSNNLLALHKSMFVECGNKSISKFLSLFNVSYCHNFYFQSQTLFCIRDTNVLFQALPCKLQTLPRPQYGYRLISMRQLV